MGLLVRWASRAFVWLLFGAILYALRSFFLLVLLTFVFAYIQVSANNRFTIIKNEMFRKWLVFIILLFIIGSMTFYMLPMFKDQAETFVRNLDKYTELIDENIIKATKDYPFLKSVIEIPHKNPEGVITESGDSLTMKFILNWLSDSKNESRVLSEIQTIGKNVLGYISAFFLGLLFSFLIVLDLQRLQQGVRNLQNTRLKFMYDQVGSSIATFGKVLGRAMEAQLVIACLNTILTYTGLYLLGISEKGAFLSVVVFVCSFIPVAGVFLSSVPICLVALQEGGLSLAVIAALYITLIHMIEAYVLNPRIYGNHLRMNPVIVLIILTIGGKLFGFWGLILGVPLCNYVFGHAIRANAETAKTVSA